MSAAFSDDSNEAVTVLPSTQALESITRGEVDMQVSTAKKFPRSLTKFKQDATTMATLDEETAAACFYTLKRGDSVIEGPGVRLAEIVASCWGNLRCEARIIDEDDRFITAQGTCWDMERNVLVRVENRRRITNRKGETFSDDMIGVTGNAAAAIAFRNAVFKVIPNAFTRAIYEEARSAAMGDSKTLAHRRQLALAWFAKAGISQERVLAMLGKQGIDDIDVACIGILAGTRTALQEGTTTLDEAFPSAPLKSGTFGFGKKAEAAAPDKDEIADAEKRWADEKAVKEAAATTEPAHDPKTGEVKEPTTSPQVDAAMKAPAKKGGKKAEAKEEPKAEPAKTEPVADKPKGELGHVLERIANAKSDADLDMLKSNIEWLPPGDKPKVMGALAQRRAELEFAGDAKLPAGMDDQS